MEEILSSIKRIIAEEDVATGPRAPRRAANAVPPVSEAEEAETFADDDQILELTDALPGETDAEAAQEEPAMTAPANSGPANSGSTNSRPAPQPAAKAEIKTAKPARPKAAALTSPDPAPAPGVMSDMSAEAARESLVNLSKLLIRPDEGQSNTLEGLVRDMLRPMLKEWLDANLPDLVEGMVKREIDRITGRV